MIYVISPRVTQFPYTTLQLNLSRNLHKFRFTLISSLWGLNLQVDSTSLNRSVGMQMSFLATSKIRTQTITFRISSSDTGGTFHTSIPYVNETNDNAINRLCLRTDVVAILEFVVELTAGWWMGRWGRVMFIHLKRDVTREVVPSPE